MSGHSVTIEAEERWGIHVTFHCDEPAEAMCRAIWRCECEQYYSSCIRNGVPAHQPDPDDPDCWHAGTFGGDCDLRAWFDEGEDLLIGKVTLPVEAQWQDGYYTFTLTSAVPTSSGSGPAALSCVTAAAGPATPPTETKDQP